MAEKSGDDEMAKELGNEVGEQLVKKLDGCVVEEEDKVSDEKLIMQCFLDEIPGDTD